MSDVYVHRHCASILVDVNRFGVERKGVTTPKRRLPLPRFKGLVTCQPLFSAAVQSIAEKSERVSVKSTLTSETITHCSEVCALNAAKVGSQCDSVCMCVCVSTTGIMSDLSLSKRQAEAVSVMLNLNKPLEGEDDKGTAGEPQWSSDWKVLVVRLCRRLFAVVVSVVFCRRMCRSAVPAVPVCAFCLLLCIVFV